MKSFCTLREEIRCCTKIHMLGHFLTWTKKNLHARIQNPRVKMDYLAQRIQNLYETVQTKSLKFFKRKCREGLRNWFSWPHGGRQKCICINVAYASHTHFNMVFVCRFILEWTWDFSPKNQSARRPIAFYLEGFFLLISSKSRCRQPYPLRTKDLRMQFDLYEYAN